MNLWGDSLEAIWLLGLRSLLAVSRDEDLCEVMHLSIVSVAADA